MLPSKRERVVISETLLCLLQLPVRGRDFEVLLSQRHTLVRVAVKIQDMRTLACCHHRLKLSQSRVPHVQTMSSPPPSNTVIMHLQFNKFKTLLNKARCAIGRVSS
uniref:Uncharacterized protein n=1 Tax=Ixodes ricinus TaxID=34613 RepID=A0A6B0UGI8_IXORI